jgi:hypothetical protein
MLLAIREHVISRPTDLPAFLAAHPLHRLYGGEHAYLLDEYRRAIENSGLRLEKTLNPLESDINLFPDTRAQVLARFARRLFLPGPEWVPALALKLAGRMSSTPGRLYSFVGVKHGE